MSNLRRYTFDLDFDAPKRVVPVEVEEEDILEEVEPPPPPPPTFSEEELEVARQAAFSEGQEQGLAMAKENSDRMVATAMTAIASQMPQVFQANVKGLDVASRDAVRVAMAVVKKMLPAAAEKYAFEEVARVVEQVVGEILDEPRIIVRVAADFVDAIRERLAEACEAHGFEGRVVVQASKTMVPGDARVEWTDGGAERSQAQLWADIERLIDTALGQPVSPKAPDLNRIDEANTQSKEFQDV